MKKSGRILALVLTLVLALGCLTPLASAVDGETVEAAVTPASVKAGSTYEDPNITVESLIDTVGLTNAANPAEATFEFSGKHCWHTDADPGEDAWVLVDLGEAVALENLYIWNLSENIGGGYNFADRDAKEISITWSADSTDGTDGTWTALGETHTVAQAVKGAEKANLVVPFGQTARFVKIQILSSYGGNYWGLGKLLFTTDISGDPVAVARRDLQAACDRASVLNAEDYTDQSWAAVEIALYQAQKLLDAGSEDAAAMEAATEELNAALDGLKEQNNVAGKATVEASEYYHDDTYNLIPENAVDGNLETWWASNNDCPSATYTFTFSEDVTVNTLTFFEYGSYNNVAGVTIRYGADRTEVSNATTPAYSGQQRTVTFDEITTNVIELTLTTTNTREGLNIAEFQLNFAEQIESTVEATGSGSEPAENLVDGNEGTYWLSNGTANSVEITVDYGMGQIVNTFTVVEAEDAEGKLTTVQVDVWENDSWIKVGEADATRQWLKKNIFLTEPVVGQKFRITLTTDGGVMKIAEIGCKLSSEDEMPVDSDLIALEPDVKPNQYQQQMVDRGYTMFIHFGINTFGETEWTYGDVDPSVYAPTQIDADQWVKTAKEAGMKTVLLVTKHHDGFCLWDSEYTDYDVGNEKSGSHVDVLQAVSDACNKYGINMGVYYSAWDNNWDKRNGKQNDAEYNEYMRNQLSEIMSGKYGLKDENGRGVISELWIDGNWEKAAARWEFDKMYDTVKRLQPECQIGLNWTIGYDIANHTPIAQQKAGDPMHYFPSDFRLGDGQETGDNDPKLFTYRGETYYLPFEATLVLNSSWFYHTGYGTRPSMDPDTIVQKYNKYKNEGNILVLNCGPNRDGQIEQADIDSLYAAARKLGIASGDALKPSASEWVDSLKGENLALGATGTSEHTYVKEPGYGPDKLFDGNRGTRWASDTGYENCVVEFTLTQEQTFNTVIVQENAQYSGRADKASLEYWDGSAWKAAGEAAFVNGEATFVLEPAITAQKLRLSVHSPKKSGPTLDEIVVTNVGAIPEVQASLDTDTVVQGGTATVSVVDAAQQIDLLSLCTFTSSNPEIAAVDSKGVVTAVAPGTATITVRLEVLGRAVEKTVTLTVQEPPHVHELKKTDSKPATCTEDGNIEYWYCAGCGKYYKDEAATQEITQAETVIKATGHTPEVLPAEEPTCTETGLTEGSKCSVCGEILKAQEETPALGHDFTDWAYNADQHWKTCSRCDAVDETSREAHKWVEDAERSGEKTVWYICECGAKKSEGRVTATPAYILKAEQTDGGKISPSSCAVNAGDTVEFSITPDSGYRIADVLVDGKSVGAVSEYTFKNVSGHHTITAQFTNGTAPVETVKGFTDVTVNDWFADAVEYAVDNGLMNGTSATTFSPKGDTTRGMIVTILYRLAGSPNVESDGATWWSDARVWAMEEGISDGTNMEGKITREQLAAMLYRYAGSEEVKGDLSAFADAESVSDWATDALIWATSTEIVTGKTGNLLDPTAGATRAETAAMLMRYGAMEEA